MDYNSEQYSGKAIKMGAGIQGFESAQAAQNSNSTVVGGECPTVGLAGGYTQDMSSEIYSKGLHLGGICWQHTCRRRTFTVSI